jgi:hypothetical protein
MMLTRDFTIYEQLPALAARADAAARVALAAGQIPDATLLLRIADDADRLFLSLTRLHELQRPVVEDVA